MEISIPRNDFYNLIKNAVREVLEEEKSKFILKNLAFVSKEEKANIERVYGKPSVKKEVAQSEIIEIWNGLSSIQKIP